MQRKKNKAKSKAELVAENKLLRDVGIGNNVTKIIVTLIRYAAYVLIVWNVYLSIDALSGKTTVADIKVQAESSHETLSETKSDMFNAPLCLLTGFLGLIFGGLGVIYGKRQAKLRRDSVEKIQGRIIELESRLHPERSSSTLTSRGDTRPEDL